ncbi:hypothetical protein [Bacillus velezensis]|uniref:hypothetical protein n=1 Tax=Bacillus velezensis TaxID=492670 RepID=UPI001F400349|nr:hypothetical protein [Bacillus velezensis]MCE4941052.1 hypothetical protein [Bacillus velezensis]
MKRRIRYVYTDAEWSKQVRIENVIFFVLSPIYLPLVAVYYIGEGALYMAEGIALGVRALVKRIFFRKNRKEAGE